MSAPDGADVGVGALLRARLRLFSDDLLIVGLILVLVMVFLLPSMIITVPAGHMGVLWRRFGGGTVTDWVAPEGTTLILPWNDMVIYDARLQSADREFEVLSSDGLKLIVTVAWRFRVVPALLGQLHKYAGPMYRETLLEQSIGARARDVIAIYRPEEIYTEHRLAIQNQISAAVRYDIEHRFNSDVQPRQKWLLIEDVLVKRIVLPEGVAESIVRKNIAHHEVEQYALIVEKEQQESERKRVEALGIRNFQEIVSGSMSEAYLRWRGIEATLELSKSENAKIVVVGNDKTGGLPLISINADSLPQGKPDARPGAAVARGDTDKQLRATGQGSQRGVHAPPAPDTRLAR